MANRSKPLPASPDAIGFDRDTVFALLADPVRRRILEILAAGTPLNATQLAGRVHRNLDAALKHMTALRVAGLLTAVEDPTDARRQLYSLSPALKVAAGEGGPEIDFGCCLVRC